MALHAIILWQQSNYLPGKMDSNHVGTSEWQQDILKKNSPWHCFGDIQNEMDDTQSFRY
jgi:hypothetical protein